MPAVDRSRLAILYWDTSAVISTLVSDDHSTSARRALRLKGRHLLSSLAYAEAASVLARMSRGGLINPKTESGALSQLGHGGWDLIEASPDRAVLGDLARRWPLFGADLWHLGLAVTLKWQLPELTLLTYDQALSNAAIGERLA